MEISTEFVFDSSHRLHNPNKSDLWNKETFGKCNNEPSHGHRWKLVVTIEGSINADSGFITNFSQLKRIVNDLVVEKFDHHFINDLPELMETVPTCENIVQIIAGMLIFKFAKNKVEYRLKELKLYETPGSWATLRL